jgi:hypothetical protein
MKQIFLTNVKPEQEILLPTSINPDNPDFREDSWGVLDKLYPADFPNMGNDVDKKIRPQDKENQQLEQLLPIGMQPPCWDCE